VSNGDSEGVRHLTYHLMGSYGLRFKEIFISAERRCKKPQLLLTVSNYLRENGIRAEYCVFIDDIETYTQAATRLGIPAIQFDATKQSADELEQALAALGFI
jgi:FMN phosphatase YigB (HAD superfamily)